MSQSSVSPSAHSAHTDAAALEAALRRHLRGEVRFDNGGRALYATDGSNYRQVPIGVVIPRDKEDVLATVALCREHRAPLLARGGGTSLAGQCCNAAVILDFSKYMSNILEVDPVRRIARVEPGVVLDNLRAAAEKHHLTFAPDPATHDRCTLGGMIGNNSCGAHSIMAGKTDDNIESLEVLTYDGHRFHVGATSDEEFNRIQTEGGRRAQIYSGLKQIAERCGDHVRRQFPNIPRRVSGYNLNHLLPENNFHVARALVGSEGTCATVLEATCRLVASPPARVLLVIGWPDIYICADNVPLIMQHGPIGLEGFDDIIVNANRRKGMNPEGVSLLPEGSGWLMVEFGGNTIAEAESQAQRLVETLARSAMPPEMRLFTDPRLARRIWDIRESSLGATSHVPGEPIRWEGFEDSAVAPEKLGAYLRDLRRLMQDFRYDGAFYGHFGHACVHTRMDYDLQSEEGVRKFRQFMEEAADLVVRYGGSLSGEHGDGQARAALLPKMFGPELIHAFQEFKAIWDPANRMNPGKLSDAVRVYDPVENLRHAPLVPGQSHTELETHFVFAADGGSLERATERCVGVGSCLNTKGGAMCPSYRATGEEQHSTRGRARLLWEMLAGALRKEGLRSKAVHQALSLCLSCKACKTECPVAVDMTAYKSEFLAQRYKHRLHPLYHYIFGFADKLARLGSIFPAMTNAVLTSPLTSPLIKRIVGVAQERKMPRLAAKSYRKIGVTTEPASKLPPGAWEAFKASGQWHGEAPVPPPPPQVVVLWPDTWNNYYHPQTLAAAEKVLTQAGFRVQIPKSHICCGRALYDFGLLGTARAYLAKVFDRMATEIDAGLPFIFLEPSCASVFRDEALELFPNNPRAQRMSWQVWLLADWLAAKAPEWLIGRLQGEQIILHGHCHHKAVFGGPANEIALLKKAGAAVELINSTCCGMAGPFGFEADKFEVSKAIANLGLLPAVNSAAPATLIVADGFSCREQINQLGHREAMHFAELLAKSCSGEK